MSVSKLCPVPLRLHFQSNACFKKEIHIQTAITKFRHPLDLCVFNAAPYPIFYQKKKQPRCSDPEERNSPLQIVQKIILMVSEDDS